MNSDYEILTPNGFQSFDGVFQKKVNQTMIVKLFDNFEIEGSIDHLIETQRGFIQLSDLQKSDKVNTIDGLKTIDSVSYKNDDCFVYDAINVSNGHHYYTNGIVSHNCEFLGSSNTLISGECLERLTFIDPVYSDDYNNLYEKPKPGNTYVCFVDVRRRRR